jgi:putative FmdB family regulatory protein
MPVYPFQCTDCDEEFSLLRTIAERSDPACCPACNAEARRVISSPNLSIMSPVRRHAAVVNERSSHAPKVTGRSHTCGSGCGCGPSAPKTKPRQRETGLGTVQLPKAGRRPWMLGH